MTYPRTFPVQISRIQGRPDVTAWGFRVFRHVTAFLANCFAYWLRVSPPSDFFGLSSLYSFRQVSITARACAMLVNQCSLSTHRQGLPRCEQIPSRIRIRCSPPISPTPPPLRFGRASGPLSASAYALLAGLKGLMRTTSIVRGRSFTHAVARIVFIWRRGRDSNSRFPLGNAGFQV